MRRYIICILLILCGIVSYASNKIQFFYFATTNDATIGNSVATDIRNMDRLYADIKNMMSSYGYQCVLYKFTGADCNPEKLNATINSMSCDGDVIVFYYSGHGGRSHSDETKFPRMCLGADYADEWVKVSDAVERIRSKAPKFFVMISDCCNSYYDRKGKGKKQILQSQVSLNKETISKLFVDNTGYVNITAASPGEFGQCTSDGGYLTLNIISALYNAGSGSNVTWESLAQEISCDTYNDTKESNGGQRPVYEIDASTNIGSYVDDTPNDSNYSDDDMNNLDLTTNNSADYGTNSEDRDFSDPLTTRLVNFVIFLLLGLFVFKKVPVILNLQGNIVVVLKIVGIALMIEAVISLFG